MHVPLAAQPQREVQYCPLADAAVRKNLAVLQLHAREDKALLLWGDALLALGLFLHVPDLVRGPRVQGDGRARLLNEGSNMNARKYQLSPRSISSSVGTNDHSHLNPRWASGQLQNTSGRDSSQAR